MKKSQKKKQQHLKKNQKYKIVVPYATKNTSVSYKFMQWSK